MDEKVEDIAFVDQLENSSSIKVQPSLRKAPTVSKTSGAELKNVKSKDLSLSYFNGLVRGRLAMVESHHTFSKLNRSVAGPETDTITLDDDDSTGACELADYFDMFSKFPFQASQPLPLLQPRIATPAVGKKIIILIKDSPFKQDSQF